MIKKTIKFKDYNGTERSEDLYFHISKASVLTSPDEIYKEIISIGLDLQERSRFLSDIETELDPQNPFDKNTQLVADSVRMVARLLDRLVDLSYGKRSEDGLKFVKNEQVLTDFKNSAVYDSFVEQMIANQDEMMEFINQLLSN